MATQLVGSRVQGMGMRFAGARALLCIVVGIALSRALTVPWWAALAAIVVALVLSRLAKGVSLYFALAGAAMFYSGLRAVPQVDTRVFEAAGFRGLVTEEPGEYGNRAVIAVEGRQGGKVLVFLRDSLQRLEYGDVVEVGARVRPFDFPRNPGLVDFSKYYLERGFIGQSSASSADLRIVGRGRGSALMRLVIVPCRRYLHRTFTELLPVREAGLLIGMLLGDRSGLPRETQDAFKEAGVMHVLAVSGLHVGVVVLVVWLLLSVFGIRGWWRFGVMVLAVAGYALLAGARVSAARAGFMACAALLSVPLQRRIEPLASIASAGVVLLLFNPGWLFDAGFQLSFAATAAIAAVFTRFEDRLRPGSYRLWRKWVALPLAVSASAYFGTVPLLLHHFHRVQLLAPVSSLLVVPLVSFAVPLAIVVAVVNLVSGAVAVVFAQALEVLLSAVNWLAGFFGSQHWALVEPGKVPWVGVLWFYLLVILLWSWRERWARVGLRLGLAAGLNLLVWTAAFARPEARATFLDAGTGDAALLEDELGRRVLVDAGIDRRLVLRDWLRSRGIRHLDVVVITHPDIDHYGGLQALDRSVRIQRVLVSTLRGGRGYEELLDRLQTEGSEIVVAGAGTEVRGFGFDCRFIWPGPTTRALYRRDLVSTNNMSLVSIVSRREFDMLLTGDLDDPDLLSGLDVECELLKSPHHGSRSGNRELLYEMAKPEYVVVMGRYPTPARLEERLPSMGDRYVNTRRDGAWVLRLGRNGQSGPQSVVR